MTELELDSPAAARLAATMWRAKGAHVARIVDASSPPGGPVLMRIDDGAVPLAELLDRGVSLGEAVTILVPLAETLVAMADQSVHGAIGVEAVRLDGSGAPILTAFRVASEHPGRRTVPEAVQEGTADRAAFRELARVVLGAVSTAGAGESERVGLALLAVDTIDVSRSSTLAAFAERLLTVASPEPVRFLGVSTSRDRASEPAPARSASRFTRIRWPRLGAKIRARVGGVRPRFWVPAVVVLVGLGIAVAVLAPADAGDVPVAPPSPSVPVDEGLALAPDEADPVLAALQLERGATGGSVVDDFGDVVLVRLDTVHGPQDVLIERTETGWTLRDTQSPGA